MAEETYKNHTITVDEEGARLTVRIDGNPVPVTRRDDGSYYTPYTPYVTYDDLDDLAHAVVDNWGYVAPVVRGRGAAEGEGDEGPGRENGTDEEA